MVPEYTTVSTASVVTDTSGKARLAFVPPEPGNYMIEISGDNAISQKMVWVSGAGSIDWPSLPNQQITLQADAEAYQPGQTSQYLYSQIRSAKTRWHWLVLNAVRSWTHR